MGEWIRFGLIALCVVTAMTGFTAAVIGANRFGFVMNRMHAAGIGDTLGIFGILLALMLKEGVGMVTAKMAVIIIFLWFTSPASSHFLSQIEYFTNPHLFRYTDRDLTVRSSMPAAAATTGFKLMLYLLRLLFRMTLLGSGLLLFYAQNIVS